MDLTAQVHAIFAASIAAKQQALTLAPLVAETAAVLIDALQSGHKILVCGNGGSAADAQHFAAELVGRFERERDALPCIALTTDTSMLTAWSNDYSFDSVFARQVAALGAPGDVLVGITTSGNSPSIVRALEEADRRGLHRVALTGRDGGMVATMPGVTSVIVPQTNTARIQEVHITVIHAWAAIIDQAWDR